MAKEKKASLSYKKHPIFSTVSIAFLTLYSLLLVVPLIWCFYSSFKDVLDFQFNPIGLPQEWLWQNYPNAFKILSVRVGLREVYLTGLIFNTLEYALLYSIIPLAGSVVVAYVCARYRSKWASVLYWAVIIIMIVPTIGGLASSLQVANWIGSYDNVVVAAIWNFKPGGVTFLVCYSTFKSLAVHAAEGVVQEAPDAAPGELGLPTVRELDEGGEPVLAGQVFRAEGFRQEPKGHAQVVAPDQLTAVQAVVLQLLPLDGGRGQGPDLIFKPTVPPIRRESQGEAVTGAGAAGLAAHHGAVLFLADAGEEVVPVEERLVQGLAVVAVFDVEIDQVRFLPLVEGEVVLPLDADLGNGITLVDLHPVETGVLVDDRFVVGGAGGQAVLLGPGLPDGQGGQKFEFHSLEFVHNRACGHAA